jgi:hypothetical protein
MGSCLRVLAVLGLENDLQALAADDKVGRKLQDLELEPSSPRAPRKRVADKSTNQPPPFRAKEES